MGYDINRTGGSGLATSGYGDIWWVLEDSFSETVEISCIDKQLLALKQDSTPWSY
jgi:hypothetical protein